jgi:hypothetical protein
MTWFKSDEKKENPEPTRGSWGFKKIQLTHIANGCNQPTLISFQPDYIRPARFDVPCADWLTQSTESQAV